MAPHSVDCNVGCCLRLLADVPMRHTFLRCMDTVPEEVLYHLESLLDGSDNYGRGLRRDNPIHTASEDMGIEDQYQTSSWRFVYLFDRCRIHRGVNRQNSHLMAGVRPSPWRRRRSQLDTHDLLFLLGP